MVAPSLLGGCEMNGIGEANCSLICSPEGGQNEHVPVDCHNCQTRSVGDQVAILDRQRGGSEYQFAAFTAET